MKSLPVNLRSAALLLTLFLSGCYFMQGSDGGGETKWSSPRKINTEDIALPAGYVIEAVAAGLTFPTGVAFDEGGAAYVVEAGYSYGEVFTTPRLLRINRDGTFEVIAEGEKNGPWNGVTYLNGSFFVAEGGELNGGKILRITPQGNITAVLEGLPSVGDHHTNGPQAGSDGFLYFGQGTATNSGVVGTDNLEFGWLLRKPDFHDIPYKDITLTGKNFETDNPLTPDKNDKALTGAYSPFGTKTEKGQVIKGRVPCTGAVMRIRPEGGTPEVIAWGFRNPFGLAFSPEGRLYITENGYDERGSRPVWGTGDVLWAIEHDKWYGWPDYSAGHKLRDIDPLIANPPNEVPVPAAILGVHSSSNGFDFSRSDKFGYKGEAFIAQFGDQAPKVGKVTYPVGFKIVRVDVKNGIINDFAVNRGSTNGPASWLEKGGLERPVAARFNPSGDMLYVVDFGVMLVSSKGISPQKGTGVLWRIRKAE